MNKLISIIIPLYNAESLINKCLTSLLKQTMTNYEIIIIDDGSTDLSMQEINKIKDERIHTYHQKHQGVSSARNLGIKYAQGYYLTFVDADDYLENNYLETLIQAQKQSNADLVICGYYMEYQKHFQKFSYPNQTIARSNFNQYLIPLYNHRLMYNTWNKLFLKKIIQKHNLSFANRALGEDHLFNQEYLKYCKSIQVIDLPLYHYVRKTPNSTTNNPINDLFNLRIKEFYEMESFFKYWQISPTQYEPFLVQRFANRILNYIVNIHKSFQGKKKIMAEIKTVVNNETVSKVFTNSLIKRPIRQLFNNHHYYQLYYYSKFIYIFQNKFSFLYLKLIHKHF